MINQVVVTEEGRDFDKGSPWLTLSHCRIGLMSSISGKLIRGQVVAEWDDIGQRTSMVHVLLDQVTKLIWLNCEQDKIVTNNIRKCFI